MKILSATEVARHFSAVMDRIEADQEEILVIRNNKRIARLVPEPAEQNALEVLGDLYRTLDDETANALISAIDIVRTVKKGKRGTLGELRDPWAS